jgi:hypothetical protein
MEAALNEPRRRSPGSGRGTAVVLDRRAAIVWPPAASERIQPKSQTEHRQAGRNGQPDHQPSPPSCGRRSVTSCV